MPLLLGQDGVAIGVVVFIPHREDTVPVGCVVRGKEARTYLLPWRMLRPAGRPNDFILRVAPDELTSYGVDEVDAEVIFDCAADPILEASLN